MLVSLLVEEELMIALFTVAADAVEFPCRYSAATPATCGDAIDVPLMVFVAVSLVYQAEVMLDPGAKISTHDPKFENEDLASPFVVEPTVRALAARAGEELQASTLLFPAATA